MTKADLDEIFTGVYPQLEEYTHKAILKLQRPIDTSTLISEAYIYLLSNRDRLEGEREVESWSKHWIKCQLHWTNGQVLRQFNKPVLEYLERGKAHQDLPRLQDWINEWYRGLRPLDKRLWDIYWVQGLTRGREVAAHLGVSQSSAYSLLKKCRELKAGLVRWIQEHYL
jgi:hypothetical protein